MLREGWGGEVLLNCPAHLKPINDKYPLVIFSNTVAAGSVISSDCGALKGRKQILCTTTTAGSHLCRCRCPFSAHTLLRVRAKDGAATEKVLPNKRKEKKARSVLKQKSSQESCNEPNWQHQQQQQQQQRRPLAEETTNDNKLC